MITTEKMTMLEQTDGFIDRLMAHPLPAHKGLVLKDCFLISTSSTGLMSLRQLWYLQRFYTILSHLENLPLAEK
jgi:hypothetical protein